MAQYLICNKHGIKKETADSYKKALAALVRLDQKGAYILDVTGGHPDTWKVVGTRAK